MVKKINEGYTIYKHSIDTDHYEIIYRERLVEVLAFTIHCDYIPKSIADAVEKYGSAEIELVLSEELKEWRD